MTKWAVFYFVAFAIFCGLYGKSLNVAIEKADEEKMSPTRNNIVPPQLPSSSLNPRTIEADTTTAATIYNVDGASTDAMTDTFSTSKALPLSSILYRRRRDYDTYDFLYHVLNLEPYAVYVHHPGQQRIGYRSRHSVWDLS